MQIPILIEPIAGNGYRASSGEPLALTAEGATQEKALAKLKKKLQARLGSGAAVVPLDLPASPHPLAEFAGMFKDDPMFEEVIEIMKENRREENATEAALESLLNRVGKRVFVHFFEQFCDENLSPGEIVALLPKQYTLKSRWSRTSKARRIIRDGLAREALEIVAASEKVEPKAAERAKGLLARHRGVP